MKEELSNLVLITTILRTFSIVGIMLQTLVSLLLLVSIFWCFVVLVAEKEYHRDASDIVFRGASESFPSIEETDCGFIFKVGGDANDRPIWRECYSGSKQPQVFATIPCFKNGKVTCSSVNKCRTTKNNEWLTKQILSVDG